jgi:hypothetical protein
MGHFNKAWRFDGAVSHSTMQLLWKLLPQVVLQKRIVCVSRKDSQHTGHSPSTGFRVAGTAGFAGDGGDLVGDSCCALSDSMSASRSAC